MNKASADNLDASLEGNKNGATGATIARPIMTTGEVFADGSTVELIGSVPDGDPQLMLWDGAKETVGSRVEHDGRPYEPAAVNSSVLQELTLPTRCFPHGTTRELVAEICKLVADFAGLPPMSASLVGRFVLCSWLVEAVEVAPALVIVGPDVARGHRLVTLLHCLCRHGLRMTGLTPAGLCSLPSGAGFTFLISQPTISDKLERLLHDASHRDQKIPHRGGLLDLFGAQVIHAESMPLRESSPLRSVQIPMIPGGAQLRVLGRDVQDQITTNFQAKLLSFRRTNLGAARKLQFDSSRFIFALRELAHSIAVATPDELELQAEVFDLLREEDEEIRAERWVESSAVAIESMLVACHESPGGFVYVGELGEIAQEILRRRGEDREIALGTFGKRLKLLGFTAEPRDSKGVKVRLTEDVRRRAQQLARDFGLAHVEDAGTNGGSRRVLE